METSSKRASVTARSAAPKAPASSSRLLMTCTSRGDTQTIKGRSGSVSVGSPGVHKVLFDPSKNLWWARGLILDAISPLLPSFLGFSCALWHGVSFFFYEIQHSPVNGCSAGSFNFGVLTEDEQMFFYSTIISPLLYTSGITEDAP